jgi:hypothetical protein
MYKSYPNTISFLDIQNTKHYLILFLLWPFMAFIAALTTYTRKESRIVVYLFLIYYGLSFVMTTTGTDSEEYIRRLVVNSERPFSEFFNIVAGIYASDTSVDIVEPLISFVVSRFTIFHGIYFAVWAALFGYFYLKSINLLYDRYKENPGWTALIMMLFLAFVLPPTSINGPRMWTAAWIFFYGAYHVIINRDYRFLFVSLSASFVHFSFLSANIVLIIYFVAGNRNYIYLPLAVASFVLPQLLAPFFQSLSQTLGGGIQNRFESYTSEGYLLKVQESYVGASWFLTLSKSLVFYFFLITLAIIQIRFGKWMKEKEEKNLFSFLLLFLAFVNFGSVVPTLGGRYQVLFLMFAAFYCFLFYLKLPSNKINLLVLIGLFPMALNVALTFRIGTESVNAWLFTPVFGLPIFFQGLSLAQFLFPS